MTEHRISTQKEWQAERDELLKEEKELTRRGDELTRKRRALPWVPVEKDYRFETEGGTKTLADLFDGRSQLLFYHFMFGPAFEAGCPVCSSIADTLAPQVPHLKARGTTLLLASRAPLATLIAYYALLDRTPRGRHESDTRPLWVRRHDEYATPYRAAPEHERGTPARGNA